MKFKGTYDELKALIEGAGLEGTWHERANSQKQFESRLGGYLNWYDTKKGTVMFQGDAEEKATLEAIILPLLGAPLPAAAKAVPAAPNKKVFVVYGHDTAARTQLETMIRRWGLEPLILDQLPSKGQTIIEKLEEYTNDVGFGIVLATPDDEGHRRDHPDEKIFRARQNVVMELGMLLKDLGRHKVAILLKDQEKMERPSDIQGLIYIPFKDDLQKDAGPTLAKEMAAQGYDINVAQL